MRRSMKRILGFSFLELVVVLGISSAVAVAGLPKIMQQADAKISERSAEEMTTWLIAARAFRQSNGAWPADAQTLIDNNYMPASALTSPFGTDYALNVVGSNMTVAIDSEQEKYATLLKGSSIPSPEVAGTVVTATVTPPGFEVALDAYLPRDGHNPMTGNFNLDGNDVVNGGDATFNGDVATTTLTYGNNDNILDTVSNTTSRIRSNSGSSAELDLATSNGTTRGSLVGTSGNLIGIKTASNEWALQARNNGETGIYHNGVEKFKTTAVGATTIGTATADQVDSNNWFHNTAANTGLVNDVTGMELSSALAGQWVVSGGGASNEIMFRDTLTGTQRGSIKATNSNDIGIADANGNWAMRHRLNSHTEFGAGGAASFEVGVSGVSGSFGTVETRGNGKSSWSGYNINGDTVFMSHNSSKMSGLYNDRDNQWIVQNTPTGKVSLYYNGNEKIQTTSTGAAVTGDLDASRDVDAERYIYFGGADHRLSQLDAGTASLSSGSLTQVALRLTTKDNVNRGTLFADTNNNVGLLDTTGNWAIRHKTNEYTEFRDGNQISLIVGETGLIGDRGTIEARGAGKGGFSGFNINGNAAFLSNDANGDFGLYDDANSQWALLHTPNGSTQFMYNGLTKITTTNAGATVTGDLSVTSDIWASAVVSAYGGAIEMRSDGQYFESGKHAITWNDGKGNFNIRVGNSPSENITEAGYAFHNEFNQSAGAIEWNISQNGAVGDAIAWANTMRWQNNGQLLLNGNRVLDMSDTGAGNGLDADMVDGVHAYQFIRSDEDDTFSGTLTGNKLFLGGGAITPGSSAALQVSGFMRTGNIYLHEGGNSPAQGSNGLALSNAGGVLQWNGSKIWTAANDGPSSGMNADLLDNLEAQSFTRADLFTSTDFNGADLLTSSRVTSINASANSPTGNGWYSLLNMRHRGGVGDGNQYGAQIAIGLTSNRNIISYRTQNAGAWDGWSTIWSSSNQGAGSSMDSDYLDGLDSTDFQRLSYLDPSSNYLHRHRNDTLPTLYINQTGTGEIARFYKGANPSATFGTSQVTINNDGSLHTTSNLFADGNIDAAVGLVFGASNFTFQEESSIFGKFLSGHPTQGGLKFANRDGTTLGGLLANGTDIGILDSDNQWAVRHVNDSGTQFRANNSTVLNVGPSLVGGSYGTVQTAGSGKGNWSGYNINGQAVFMANGSSAGIYNDASNEWFLLGTNDGALKLYFNGTERVTTTNTGAQISGELVATGDVSAHNGDIRLGSNGLYLESDLHAITWNDGQGNFNIRVGNSTSEKITEDGYAFHTEYSQGNGNLAWKVSQNGVVGDAITWQHSMVLNGSGQLSLDGDRVYDDGYRPEADKWTNARTVSLGGDITGSASFDGSSNFTLSGQVVNDSHTHDTRYYTETESDNRFARLSLGSQDGEINRDVKAAGLYTYNVTNSNANKAPNTAYGSVITWGRGQAGAAQLSVGWTGSDQNSIYFRSLRDTTDNWWAWKKIFHEGNDGAGSQLSADYLDDLDSTQFVRSDVNDTFTGILTGNRLYLGGSPIASGSSAVLQVNGFMRTGNIYIHEGGNSPTANSEALSNSTGTLQWAGATVWTSANDGSSSGLSADDLDGFNSTQFLRSDTGDISTGNIKFNAGLTLGNNQAIAHNTNSSRDKYRVWSSSDYAIGMGGGYYYGGLNNTHAMTFQMDNTANRGFWWGRTAHSNSQGAMALTTDGKLSVADSMRLGYGTSDTSAPGSNATLDVNGNIYIAAPGYAQFGPNGDLSTLRIGSNNDYASLSTSATGDAFLESAKGSTATYLNYNNGTKGTYFGQGNGQVIATIGDYSRLGNYGTYNTQAGTGKGGWDGYSINGRVVFMHDNNTGFGIYDDVNNKWALHSTMGGSTNIRYNGNTKLATTNSGVDVTGILSTTGNISSGSNIVASGNITANGKLLSDRLESITGSGAYIDMSYDELASNAIGITTYNSIAVNFDTNNNSTGLAFTVGHNGNVGDAAYEELIRVDGSNTFTYKGNDVFHRGLMGSGSGLDADKLDNLDSTQFLRSDTSDTMYGQLTVNHGATIGSTNLANGSIIISNGGNMLAMDNNEIISNQALNIGTTSGDINLKPTGVVRISGSRVYADNYHPYADRWTNAITMSLAGDLSGSISFDGSSNFTINGQVANDSHLHDGRYFTESESDSRYQRTNYIDTSNAYLFRHRNSSNAVAYFNQTGSGDIARFYKGASATDTGGNGVVIANDGSLSTTADVIIERDLLLRTIGDQYRLGADDYENSAGITIRPADNNNPNNGDKIFTVRSGGGSPRLFVEHNGRTGTSNSDFYVGVASDSTGGNRVYHDGYHPFADDSTLFGGLTTSQFMRSDQNTSTTGDLYIGPTAYNRNSANFAMGGSAGSFGINIQDGSGRMNMRWNASSGTASKFLVDGDRAWEMGMSGIGGYGLSLKESTAGGVAGTDVIWDTIMSIGRTGFTYLGDKVWTQGNDGQNSLLDADYLDGIDSSRFLRSDIADVGTDLTLNTLTVPIINGSTTITGDGVLNLVLNSTNSRAGLILNNSGATQGALYAASDGIRLGYGPSWAANTGIHIKNSNGYVGIRNNAPTQALDVTGNVLVSNALTTGGGITASGDISTDMFRGESNSSTYLDLSYTELAGNAIGLVTNNSSAIIFDANNSSAGLAFIVGHNGNVGDATYEELLKITGTNTFTYKGNKIFHEGFQGSGSGLDADTLDGYNSSQFLRSDTDDFMAGTLTIDSGGTIGGSNLDNGAIVITNGGLKLALDSNEIYAAQDLTIGSLAGSLNLTTVGGTVKINGGTAWHSSNDGVGSGLDADRIDNLSSEQFLRADAADIATGLITFNAGLRVGNNQVITHSATQSRDKYRVWSGAPYSIGMDSGYTFGHLNNDYAMTFQMNNDADRGFWWGHEDHTNAQGAMSLTTNGKLHVANSITIGSTSNVAFHDGYHPNADKWTTARKLTLAGDLSGTVTFDGSSNFTLTAAVANDSHTHDTRYYTETESDNRFARLELGNQDGEINREVKANGIYSYNVVNTSANKAPGTNYGSVITWGRGTGGAAQLSAGWTAGDQDSLYFRSLRNTTDNWWAWKKIFHEGNDGSGSSLSADYLDELDSSQFVRSDVGGQSQHWARTFLGTTGASNSLSGNDTAGLGALNNLSIGTWHGFSIHPTISGQSVALNMPAFSVNARTGNTYTAGYFYNAGQYRTLDTRDTGAGNGLNADMVDGLHGYQFLRSDTNDSFSGTITGNTLLLGGGPITSGSSAALQVKGFMRTGNIYLHEGGNSPAAGSSALALSNVGSELQWNGSRIWTAANDGPGSSLNADLLDNLNSTQFLRSDTADTATGLITFNSGLNIGGTAVINHNTKDSRDKIRVWNNGTYAIGMNSGYTFGGLNNDFAMTFQMSNSANRGFWWGDSAHTNAQGAMALSTTGKLTVADSIRVGFGEGDIVVPGSEATLHVRNNGKFGYTNGNVANSAITSTADRYVEIGIQSGGGAGQAANYPSSTGIVFHHEGISTGGFIYQNTAANSVRYILESDKTIAGLYITSGLGGTVSTERVYADNYHPNADKWTTARKLTLAGDLSGNVTFDGSGNFTLNATVLNDSHTHDSRYFTETESNNRFVQKITTVDDITSRIDSGFYQTSSASIAEGYPENATWFHLLSSTHSSTSNNHAMQFAGDFYDSGDLYYRVTNNNGNAAWSKIFSEANMGSGSGLDADTLDGLDSTDLFFASQGAVTTDFDNYLNTGSYHVNNHAVSGVANGPAGSYGWGALVVTEFNGSNYIVQEYTPHQNGGSYKRMRWAGTWTPWRTIYSDLNDGSGSGLDADLLDGLDSKAFARGDVYNHANFNNTEYHQNSRLTSANVTSNTPFGAQWYTIANIRHRGGESDGTDFGTQLVFGMTANTNRMSFRTQNSGTWGSWNHVFNSNHMGQNSGLDADKIDGFSSEDFQTLGTIAADNRFMYRQNSSTGLNAVAYFNQIDNGRIAVFMSGASMQTNSTTTATIIENDGSITTPKIVDINNSAYYLDPASVSNLNQLKVAKIIDPDNSAYVLDPSGYSNLGEVEVYSLVIKRGRNEGGSCSTNGELGVETNGAIVNCVSGTWKNLSANGSQSTLSASSGSLVMASGAILKWGKLTVGSSWSGQIPFDVQFPNNCVSVSVSQYQSGRYSATAACVDKTKLVVGKEDYGGWGGNTGTLSWMAVGY